VSWSSVIAVAAVSSIDAMRCDHYYTTFVCAAHATILLMHSAEQQEVVWHILTALTLLYLYTAVCTQSHRCLESRISGAFEEHMHARNGSGYVNFDAAAGTLELVVQPNQHSNIQTTAAVRYVTTASCCTRRVTLTAGFIAISRSLLDS
jgi:hypothetical protein